MDASMALMELIARDLFSGSLRADAVDRAAMRRRRGETTADEDELGQACQW